MSAGPPGAVPAGDLDAGPAAERPAGARGSAFALPARTSFRFALLIAAVVASSSTVYSSIYLATSRGPALVTLLRVCRARALSSHPKGLSAYASALGQARACYAGAEYVEGLWVLLGIAVLGVVAVAIFWAQPWWYRRQMRLTPLTSEAAPLLDRLEQLRARAGTGPVVWLLQPFNVQQSAFAFGRSRRHFVAVSAGAAVAAVTQPTAFDAIVLHELAHTKNKDINQTYLAIAIWRAFVIAALLPLIWLLAFSWGPGGGQRIIWRVAILALVVYSLRNSILRSREFDADARVREIDPDTALGAVLAGQPPRRGRLAGAWHLGWRHPSGQDRAAALLDPAPLYRCGLWDGLVMGLVAAVGAEAVQDMVHLLVTVNAIGGLIPAVIFALFSGTALTVAMWRNRFMQAEAGTVTGWAAGLGLGIGVALGPVITLSAAFDQGVAPDSLHPEAIAVLAVWVALVTIIFVSVPVWVGHWADAWQYRAGRGMPRVPARGGMLVAAAGTWAVLAVGLDLVLAYSEVVSSTSTIPAFLEQTWTTAGQYAAEQLGALVVCLVFIAVPLAASIAGLRQRRAGGARDTAPGLRPWLGQIRPVALICLAGAAAMVALALATAAVVHARIAPAVRWNGLFYGNFSVFQVQAMILVAVIFALIAGAQLASAQSLTIAVAVGAIVAALGIFAIMGALTVGNCTAPFSVTYTQPPATLCPGDPGFYVQQIRPAAVEAALIGILLVPAAYGIAVLIARRGGSQGRTRLSARASRWLAAGIAVAAVIAVFALRVPDAAVGDAHPFGTIGDDGWIYGAGYEIRLFPNWYEIAPAANRAYLQADYAGPSGVLTLAAARVPPGTPITGKGGHPILLGGARGLGFVFPDLQGHSYTVWIVIRDSIAYKITLSTAPGDYASLEPSFTAMVNSWRWVPAA